jgi:hypothetical protein
MCTINPSFEPCPWVSAITQQRAGDQFSMALPFFHPLRGSRLCSSAPLLQAVGGIGMGELIYPAAKTRSLDVKHIFI